MLTSTGLATVDADACRGPSTYVHGPLHQTLSAIAAYTMATVKNRRTARRTGREAGAAAGPHFITPTAAPANSANTATPGNNSPSGRHPTRTQPQNVSAGGAHSSAAMSALNALISSTPRVIP